MRHFIAILFALALFGCAAKQEKVKFYSEPTPAEDFAGDALLFMGGAALDMLLWDNGHPDITGQSAPDWWTKD